MSAGHFLNAPPSAASAACRLLQVQEINPPAREFHPSAKLHTCNVNREINLYFGSFLQLTTSVMWYYFRKGLLLVPIFGTFVKKQTL
jgi:hypothetical protein